MKPVPPDLSTGVSYSYMPVTAINAGLAAARAQRGEPIFKVNRKPRGGGSSSPGTATSFVKIYDDLKGASPTATGGVTWNENVRTLPMIQTATGLEPDLTKPFTLAKWPSMGSLSLSGSGCCGSDSTGAVPTGARIDNPTGPDGINRVKNGQTLTLEGTGAVPGESLTASIISINPTTGATVGSALEPVTTNNGDGTWGAAAQSLATLPRGLCLATITNGATQHSILVLNSLDEWEPGESNGTGLVYWTDKPDAPDLHVDSDTGDDTADNVTDDTEPTFTIRFGATEVITPGSDVEAILYLIDQSDGTVTAVTGELTDFNDGLTIQRAVDSPLAIGTYEVQAVLRLAFDGGYPYNEWWSPPSNPLRLQVVEDVAAVPAKRYARLGSITKIGGINYVSVDGCPVEITEAEAEKLDAA